MKNSGNAALDSYVYVYNPANQRTNLTRLDTSTVAFKYDPIGQLKVADSSVNTEDRDAHWRTEFAYDGLGRLRQRNEYSWASGWHLADTVNYVYDGWRVIQERDSNNVPAVSYTRGNDLSGSMEGAGGIGGMLARSFYFLGGTFHDFYFADGNGNITSMLDSSQNIVASYRYDPFGNTISLSGLLAGANTYRFSSKELMGNSGLYYYGYRFYDPNLQRWINRDPIGEVESGNLYAFVRNNPIARVDSFGLFDGQTTPGHPWPIHPPPVPPPQQRCAACW